MQQDTPGQGHSADGLIGRVIAGYRITRYIARGGMGVVYEGVQVSLDRPVAIKILYPHLADDPSFVERFQKEARSEARLNHPHIVRVLDFGSDNGAYYMVMDFIEGESLRDRLTRVSADGLTLNTNVMMRIVEEVGSALTFAHNLGLAHRDVKPGNVLLGKDGHAYLADFGVVKILGEASMTTVGTIVGTPEYMAPEQGSGAPDIGPAADLYSLAIITYEMMVGRAPFRAPTPAAVLQMQLAQPPPPPSTLVPWFAPEVEEVIMRALSKDPTARQAGVEAYVQELRIATAGIRERATSRYSAPATMTTEAVTGSAAGAVVTGATAPPTPLPVSTPPSAPPVTGVAPPATSSAPTPAESQLSGAELAAAAASAAGRASAVDAPATVAGAILVGAGSDVGSNAIGAGVPPVGDGAAGGNGGSDGSTPPPAGTDGPVPESRRSSRRELILVALVGLAVIALAAYMFTRDDDDGSLGGSATATSSLGGVATATGASEATPTDVPQVEATATVVGTAVIGGVATPTEQPTDPTATIAAPADPTATEAAVEASPTQVTIAVTPTVAGGAPPGFQSVILFASHRGEVHDSQIYIMNPDGSEQRQLTFSRGHSWGPRFSPDGEQFIFSSVAPGEHTEHSATGGGAAGQGNHDIYLSGDDGSNITKITFLASWDNGWSWSPDGATITFTSDRDGNWEIYQMNPDGSNVVRITNNPGQDGWPSWTPDGSQIVFSSDRSGDWEIYSMNADGTGVRQLTDRVGTVDTYPFVSPDGTRIAFSSQFEAANEGEIYVMDIDGANVTRLTSTAALNYAPSWAPDGSKIIFVSDRDGNDNIYIMNPDGTSQQRLTTDPGEDTTPSWAWIKLDP